MEIGLDTAMNICVIGNGKCICWLKVLIDLVLGHLGLMVKH